MQNAIKNENEHQQETIIQLKNTKQTIKSKSWSKSSGTCSSPQFLRWSIHCRRFLSAQSFATLVLTGTTPLAAMDCCSSVTHAPKRLGFFRLNDSLFWLADLKEEFSHHELLLQPFASSPFHCKNARQSRMVSANQLADDTMESWQDDAMALSCIGWRNRKNGRLERSAVCPRKSLYII